MMQVRLKQRLAAMSEADRCDFGQRLKLIRASRTMQDLAASIGVSQSYWSRLEHGKAAPGWHVLQAICRVEGVSPEWLVTGHGDRGTSGDPDLRTETLFCPRFSQAFLKVVEGIKEWTGDEALMQSMANLARKTGESEVAMLLRNLDAEGQISVGTRYADGYVASDPLLDGFSLLDVYKILVDEIRRLSASEEVKNAIDRLAVILEVSPRSLFAAIVEVRLHKEMERIGAELAAEMAKDIAILEEIEKRDDTIRRGGKADQ